MRVSLRLFTPRLEHAPPRVTRPPSHERRPPAGADAHAVAHGRRHEPKARAGEGDDRPRAARLEFDSVAARRRVHVRVAVNQAHAPRGALGVLHLHGDRIVPGEPVHSPADARVHGSQVAEEGRDASRVRRARSAVGHDEVHAHAVPRARVRRREINFSVSVSVSDSRVRVAHHTIYHVIKSDHTPTNPNRSFYPGASTP